MCTLSVALFNFPDAVHNRARKREEIHFVDMRLATVIALLLLATCCCVNAAVEDEKMQDMKNWIRNGPTKPATKMMHDTVQASSTSKAPILDDFDWKSLLHMTHVAASGVFVIFTGALFASAVKRETHARALGKQLFAHKQE